MTLEALRGKLALRRDELRRLSVVILAGGGSTEREVSLTSGEAIARELTQSGYQAQLLPVSHDDISLDSTHASLASGAAPAALQAPAVSGALAVTETAGLLQCLRQVDMIFTTMHGSRGENGAWQGLLELLGVPYVSAGVKGSAVAMDKLIAKYVFERLAIPTPRYWLALPGLAVRQDLAGDVTELVAKPVDQGSSVGIEMVHNDDPGWAAIGSLVQRFGRVLVEERIYGRELTAGVIGPSTDPLPLPLVEIKPKQGFYDYTAKYTSGASEYVCPAEVEPALAAKIQQHALRIYQELDLEPYSRIDCLLDAQGCPWFLEANTLPGFTALSLLPRAARAAGLDFCELLEVLMLCALERHERQREGAGA